MTFKVIDTKTGKEPTNRVIDNIALKGGLIRTDIDQFYVGEDGSLVLADDCGNMTYCDSERFKVVADRDHTCHTCKHYLPGEYDGSCGSYICKNYSGWEDKERNKEGDKGMKNEFLNMTDYELLEYLRLYAHDRKGELADLCYAASIRIAVLSTGENRESKECGTSN